MATRTNWIANPSAEVDIVRAVEFGSTLTRTTTEASVGSASFQVVPLGTAGFQGCGLRSLVSLGHTGVAQPLVGSVALKGSGTVNVSIRTWYTDATATEGTRSLVTLSGTWQTVALPSVATTAAKTVDYYEVLIRTNSAQAITFYTDAALIEFGTVAGPYFDGDSPNARWAGTPHVSASILTIPEMMSPLLKIGSSHIGPLRVGKA